MVGAGYWQELWKACWICKQMVRKGGLEPPWVAPPDPKSGASANFATFALGATMILSLSDSEATRNIPRGNVLPIGRLSRAVAKRLAYNLPHAAHSRPSTFPVSICRCFRPGPFLRSLHGSDHRRNRGHQPVSRLAGRRDTGPCPPLRRWALP